MPTLLSDPAFLSRNEISQNAQSVLNAAKLSISENSNRQPVRLKSEVKPSVRRNHIAYWNSTQVQSKFKDIVVLEGTSHVWNHMLAGLLVGELSFLLRAGADCLSTPMNLC